MSTWPDFLDRIEIRFPFPIEARALVAPRGQPGGGELRVALDVPDVVTGEPTRVYTHDFPPPVDDIAPGQYLRNLILRALAHELDECLFVDGKKLNDPHTMQTYVPLTLRTSNVVASLRRRLLNGDMHCIFCLLDSRERLDAIADNLKIGAALCRAYALGAMAQRFASDNDDYDNVYWSPGCGRVAP